MNWGSFFLASAFFLFFVLGNVFIGIVIVITGDVIDGGGGFFSLLLSGLGSFARTLNCFYLFSPRSSYGKGKKDILGSHDTQNAGRVIQFLQRFQRCERGEGSWRLPAVA